MVINLRGRLLFGLGKSFRTGLFFSEIVKLSVSAIKDKQYISSQVPSRYVIVTLIVMSSQGG